MRDWYMVVVWMGGVGGGGGGLHCHLCMTFWYIISKLVKFSCLLICSWWYMVLFVTAWFGAWMNCLVHVVMYTYYGLSAIPSLKGKLWWKRYITRFQLVGIKWCLWLAPPRICLVCFCACVCPARKSAQKCSLHPAHSHRLPCFSPPF